MGFIGEYIIFHIFAQGHRLRVLGRTTSLRFITEQISLQHIAKTTFNNTELRLNGTS